MTQTVVTVVIAVVGVVAFVAMVLCAMLPLVVRLGEENADAPPLLARTGPQRVPHSPAAVCARPAPPSPRVAATTSGDVVLVPSGDVVLVVEGASSADLVRDRTAA